MGDVQKLDLTLPAQAPAAPAGSSMQALWFPVLALTAFGLLFVYSSSSVYASQKYDDEFLFVKKQALYLIPSFLAAFIGARLSLAFLERHALRIAGGALGLTVLTLLPYIGKRVGGAKRWIALGPLQGQPGEFLKIASILFAAGTLARHPHQFWRLAPVLLCFGVFLLQPDFGSCVILGCGLVALLFLHGIPGRAFLAGLALVLPAAITLMVAAPYRVKRLVTFLNPFADPQGSGFQVIQSFIAIAGGGWFGKGLGGSQQKLFFLPEAHTDFIFAVLAEEMGFAGVLVVAMIFALLFYTLLQIAARCRSHFERLMAAGMFAMIAGGTLVNMGVVVGVLPTKGLPLPFLSAGGSAMIANFFAIGLFHQFARNASKGQ